MPRTPSAVEDRPETPAPEGFTPGVNETPPAPPVEDRLRHVREKRDQLAAEVAEFDESLAEMVADYGEDATTKKAYLRIKADRDNIAAKAAALTKQLENANVAEAQRTLTGPIINLFGSLTVDTTDGLPATISYADIHVKREKAAELRRKAASLVAVCDLLQTAVDSVVGDEALRHDLRPFQVVSVDSKTVKIAVASGKAGTTGGKGRTRGGNIQSRITAIDLRYDQSIVGKTVGTRGSDYESWKAFVKAVDPALAARYEGQTRSMTDIAAKKMAVRAERDAPVPA